MIFSVGKMNWQIVMLRWNIIGEKRSRDWASAGGSAIRKKYFKLNSYIVEV